MAYESELAITSAPLLKYRFLSHRPGESLEVHSRRLGDVRRHSGIGQGRANFQVVVLSLFRAAFAEVSFGEDEESFVKVSGAVNLAPLRAGHV
ncbi:hypothetical protein BDV11DRAFT_190207 [Aspergillus similis]